MSKSNKEKIVALILCIFLGTLGIHRFYVGKTKSGILYLCTLGLFGIGWIYDIFNIANNLFTDSYGAILTSENANHNILNESKKKPAHMMWQFWVAVVILYVFAFVATPSNSNKVPTTVEPQISSDVDTTISNVENVDAESKIDTESTTDTNTTTDTASIVETHTDTENNTEKSEPLISATSQTGLEQAQEFTFVRDTRTNVFHTADCSLVADIPEEYRDEFTSPDVYLSDCVNKIEILYENQGYKHCTECLE